MTIWQLLLETPFYLDDHYFLYTFLQLFSSYVVQVKKEFSVLKYTFSVVLCQVNSLFKFTV